MAALPKTSEHYLIALGGNVRHARHGHPRAVLAAALAALEAQGVAVERASPVLASRPLGPSLRTYANGAALVRTRLAPGELLALLKHTERAFGRRAGRRWGSRVLDLDIVLWGGGRWASRGLEVPHRAYRQRDFVLRPLLALAPAWRDPVSGFTPRQLFTRLTKPRPALRGAQPRA